MIEDTQFGSIQVTPAGEFFAGVDPRYQSSVRRAVRKSGASAKDA